MRRTQGKPNLQICTADDDPRIRSKCSTPNNIQNKKKLRQEENRGSQMSSEIKRKNKLKQAYKSQQNEQERTAIKNKEISKNQYQNYQFQKNMQKQIHNYHVIAGTLRQYIKDQQSKGKKKKNMGTVIQIIKAYTKTHVKQVSPNVSTLIVKMLETLPISRSHSQKQKKSRSITSNLLSQSQRLRNKNNYQSIMEKKVSDENLGAQIKQLQQNLLDLQQQGQVLEQMRCQFEQMSQIDKKNYITELEQIIIKQKQMLQKLDQDDQNYIG